MPYVITTTKPHPLVHPDIGAGPNTVTRYAVATLEEAHERVRDYIGQEVNAEPRAIESAWNAAEELTEQGGTIGPLPDGTVIEVELVAWSYLDTWSYRDRDDVTDPDSRVIDAYNQEQNNG